MEYRREVDGLRAIAVLPVMLFHAGFGMFGGGFVGVDVFFVISGYLITNILITELSVGAFSIGDFYERRARRILPALFLVILICLPFSWFWLLPGELKEFSGSLVAVLLFASNFFFWVGSGYFDITTELKPLLHTWSLAVEEQYYVIYPVFLAIIWRHGRARIVLLLLLVCLLSLCVAHWGSLAKPHATFYLLPTRAWELLIGALVAFQLVSSSRWRASRIIREVAGSIGILLILYSVIFFDKFTPFPGLYALVPTVGAALVLLFVTSETFVGRFLGAKLLVGIGVLSYSAYLWHQPLFAFARIRTSQELDYAIAISLCLATFGLAYFSWRYIESPFRDRVRFNRYRLVLYCGIVATMLLLFGAVGYSSQGFLLRYEAADQKLASLQPREIGLYVERRFKALTLQPFDSRNMYKKVLIIGDSYAQDLVNALHEGGLARSLQISTRHIDAQCGNLFIGRENFQAYIHNAYRLFCRNKGIYEDEELRAQMAQADEIWFSSDWQSWQADLLPASLENVRKLTRKPVRVFGSKSLGKVNIRQLLAVPLAQRLEIKIPVKQNVLATNALLRRTLPAEVYIDVQVLLCGPDSSYCGAFSPSGELKSHDGGHLTSAGATLLGARLAEESSLRTHSTVP